MAVSAARGSVGPGLAWSYYYGYLKLVLPGMVDRVKNSEFSDESKWKCRIFPKMLILLPTSCFCPSALTDDDPAHFRFVGHIPFKASRAGNIARDYKSSVYEVQNPSSPDQKVLIIVELATPLMSMYEMSTDGMAQFDDASKREQRQVFIDTLRSILDSEGAKPCHGACAFLEYEDPRDDSMKANFSLAQLIWDFVEKK